jgi:hypothetical protein
MSTTGSDTEVNGPQIVVVDVPPPGRGGKTFCVWERMACYPDGSFRVVRPIADEPTLAELGPLLPEHRRGLLHNLRPVDQVVCLRFTDPDPAKGGQRR